MEAIIMPALGQTSDEAYILEWLYQEGNTVEMGEPLLRVETDKAQLDVECVADGVLVQDDFKSLQSLLRRTSS